MLPKKSWIIISVFLLLISLPYLIGYLGNSATSQFSGILQNPGDAYSYLAKMRQGSEGEWLFKLPFTPTPGEGRALFLYYYLLGHISALFHTPLIIIYHLARIFNSIFLVGSIALILKKISAKWQISQNLGLFFTLFGSGLGWIYLRAGQTPTDLWVAEGYPFLSAYTNSHFPLALAIMVISIYLWILDRSVYKYFGLFVTGLMLSIILPFGSVILLILFGLDTALGWFLERQFNINAFLVFGISSLPYLIYSLGAIQSQPLLKIWNSQNVTPSAPAWDILLAFSPALIIAIYGGFHKAMAKDRIGILLLLWIGIGFGLCFLPISLQRRFLIGLYIPCAILATNGIAVIPSIKIRRYIQWLYTFLILPTNILVIIVSMYGVSTRDQRIYLSTNEVQGINWLDSNAQQEDVVLASAVDGLILPALAGVKVIYGHPFETPNATEAKQLVEFCLKDITDLTCKNYLLQNQVRYVYLSGTNEEITKYRANPLPGQIVYKNPNVIIYEYQP